jgi:pimeloyl-ACP methyl ester carboxylesterase
MSQTLHTETGFAEVDGTRLYYEVAGKGQPLVLVHAGIADLRMWDNQFNVLAQHFRVVRYDMRGFGQSEPVEGTFSHHQNLFDLLQFLSIERAFLIGCSMGGGVCIDFTLEHPQHAAALILVCSAPNGMPYEGEPPPIWEELVAAHKAGDLDRVNELEVRIWVDGLYRTPQQVEPTVRERVRAMNSIVLRNEQVGKGREQPLAPPAIDRMDEIGVPTLAVVGDLDVPPTHQAATLMVQRIAGARQAVIAGTAHLPNMERPDEFNRIVLEFLQGL